MLISTPQSAAAYPNNEGRKINNFGQRYLIPLSILTDRKAIEKLRVFVVHHQALGVTRKVNGDEICDIVSGKHSKSEPLPKYQFIWHK